MKAFLNPKPSSSTQKKEKKKRAETWVQARDVQYSPERSTLRGGNGFPWKSLISPPIEDARRLPFPSAGGTDDGAIFQL